MALTLKLPKGQVSTADFALTQRDGGRRVGGAYAMTDAQRDEIMQAAALAPPGLYTVPTGDHAERAPRPRRQLPRGCLDALFTGGQIRAEQLRAGEEIARVYQSITAAIFARSTASYSERLDIGQANADLPPGLGRAITERYIPWREWSQTMMIKRTLNIGDLTLYACADGLGIEQLALRCHIDRRYAKRHLQISLAKYVEIACWDDDAYAKAPEAVEECLLTAIPV